MWRLCAGRVDLRHENPKAMKTCNARHHDPQPVFTMAPILDGSIRLRSLHVTRPYSLQDGLVGFNRVPGANAQ